MPLSNSQKEKVEKFLQEVMIKKIGKYKRESKSMPFLTRIVQDNELVASYSLVHSWATALGQSIFEKLAVKIVEHNSVTRNHLVLFEGIDPKRGMLIKNILNELSNKTRQPNKSRECKELLAIPNSDPVKIKDGAIVDFYMKREGIEYYFEIKTVKPNISEVISTKQKMLEWVARKNKPIKSIVALPYNPYAPDAYNRFTIRNFFDKREFLIAEEFWDFLGGPGAYDQLMEIFDKVGKSFKDELQKKFKELSKDIDKV